MKFKPRFSLRTLLLVVTLICPILAWWKYAVTLQYYRTICSQAVAGDLNQRHWQAVSSGSRTQSLPPPSLFGLTSWNDQGPPLGWNVGLILPGGTFRGGSIPDDFEKQLLFNWTRPRGRANNASDETAERNRVVGQFTYYKAIRATSEKCAFCHAANGDIHVGDLIAVAKVTSPQ